MKLIRPSWYKFEVLASEWGYTVQYIENLVESGQLKAEIRQGTSGLFDWDLRNGFLGELDQYLSRFVPLPPSGKFPAGSEVVIPLESVLAAECFGKTATAEPSQRQEKALLRVIGALLGIIDGGYPSKEILKHQSVKNQSDLVSILADAEEFGLSKRNLEKYFAEAKKAIKT